MTSISRPTIMLAFVLMMLGLAPVHAQPDSNTTATAPTEVGFIPRRNLIKVGVTSSVARTASVMYERTLNPNISVALTVSYMMPITPSRLLDLSTERLVLSADRTLSGIFLTPEVKWFLETSDKRTAPRGLYVGGYLRYSDLRYTSAITATSAAQVVTGSISSNLSIDLFEYGVGLTAGYQFMAWNDRLVFDALFFGPRFSGYKLRVRADLNGDGQLAEDLSNALEDAIGHQIVPLELDVSDTGSTTINRNSLGYRYGLKIGYAF